MTQRTASSQDTVFDFLADPASHGLDAPVTRIDTHGAAVFLAGKDVYKVKKAVRFPFLDYSTLAKRKWACEQEIAVNQGNAPELYLDVVPVTQEEAGLRIGGGGPVVEWMVHLRRFDENRTLDRLAERGALGFDIVAPLAAAVSQAHRRARPVYDHDAGEALRRHMEETLDSLEAAPAVFVPGDVARLRAAMQQNFEAGEPLLLERQRQGQVRRCHGDLHLRNIVMIDERPVLFDAIEFDEKIATCDELHDLAFLLMDLWTRGLHPHANLLLNRYLWICESIDVQLKGLFLLPLFLSVRAAIRAKVAILQPGGAAINASEARHYFEAACEFIAPHRLDFVAIGGLSGTGKSTLAAALAPSIGRAPGAIHLRSDIERKRLLGAQELDRLPQEAYSKEMTARTYQRLRDLSAIALEAGQCVIADAVHLRQDERLAAEEIARKGKAHFTGVWLEATQDVLIERVEQRMKDASDATVSVVSAQMKEPAGEIGWMRFEASAPAHELAADVLTRILS